MSAVATVAGTTAEIPLFPLNTVLFPGGPLPLRIFETRYTDMVRRCMREQSGFGVVLIQSDVEAGAGPETDRLARTADTGTQATIIDFNQLPDGLLGITCLGGSRFRILRRWRAADGLNLAQVTWLPEAPRAPVSAANAYLVDILRKLLPELGDVYQFVKPDFDSADWVGSRLAEVLPVSLQDKQVWADITDPAARLDQLASMIRTPPN